MSESSENLLKALQRLQIQSYKNNALMAKKRTRDAKQSPDNYQTRQLTASGIINEEDILYGPLDEDVQSVVKTVMSIIKTVAHSLDTVDFQFQLPPSNTSEDHYDLFGVLQMSGFSNFTNQIAFSSSDNIPSFKMAIGSAIWNWTFYARGPAAPVDRIQNRYEALFDVYRETSLSHGEHPAASPCMGSNLQT
jgi:hypothetical protein